MKRKDALKAMEAAGIANDRAAFLRLYAENRISLDSARDAFARGRDMAKRFADRDDVQRNSGNLYMGPAA